MSAHTFSKGRFPVGAWLSPPPKVMDYPQSFVEDIYFRWAAEAGINALYALYEDISAYREETLASLDLCAKYGIDYLVNDPTIRTEQDFDEAAFLKSLRAYRAHPAFCGLHVKDEPGVKQFPALAKKREVFLTACPDKTFYVNLLPVYATPYHLLNGMWTAEDTTAEMDYETYLDRYLGEVRPQMLSYDFYPMTGASPHVEPGYFRQLRLAGNRAHRAGVPLWVFIQTCSFGPNVRVPNAAEIAWQVNTALACGAKGIQYFTYIQPANSRYESFEGGLVDRSGARTPAYDAVRAVNKQIVACGRLLLSASLRGVAAVGDSPDPVPDTEEGVAPAVTGKHLLVGRFRAGERKFLYVANNSFTEEDEVAAAGARFVRSVAGGVERKLSGNALRLRLPAGGGVLIEYEEER